MVGIVGIVGKTDVAPLLIESLVRLEDRGGDFCGLAVLDEEMGIDLRKDVGPVEEVTRRFDMVSAQGRLGIAHVRWAAQEGVSQENAHPHLSCDRNFAVVHSGSISNHEEIGKALLWDRNSHFFSQTRMLRLLLTSWKKFTGQAFLSSKYLSACCGNLKEPSLLL